MLLVQHLNNSVKVYVITELFGKLYLIIGEVLWKMFSENRIKKKGKEQERNLKPTTESGNKP